MFFLYFSLSNHPNSKIKSKMKAILLLILLFVLCNNYTKVSEGTPQDLASAAWTLTMALIECERVKSYCRNSVTGLVIQYNLVDPDAYYFFNTYYGYCKYALTHNQDPNAPEGSWNRAGYDLVIVNAKNC
jgi:hypothetical protein